MQVEADGDVLPPPTLASLPTVILEQILTTAWFTLASDDRVVPPLYVAVCKAWRELALSLPTIALRIDDRKRDAIDWSSIFCRCEDRKTLRVTELALTNCNVRSEELATLLRAVPLRLLSLQNCRSIDPDILFPALPSSLRALLLCGLNGAPARALAEPHVVEAMRELRVLGLHDCECPATDLMRLLPWLPALTALLVGGADILNESLGDAAVVQQANDSTAAHAKAVLAAPAPARLAVVEATHASDIAWGVLRAHLEFHSIAPKYATLDLCADAPAVHRGLAELRATLDGVLDAPLASRAFDLAVGAALCCRNGRRSTPLHAAAISGDEAAAPGSA